MKGVVCCVQIPAFYPDSEYIFHFVLTPR